MILKYTSYFLVKDKKKIKNIYINSFNKDERFSFLILEKCAKEKNVEFNVVYDNNDLIGFYYIVNYGDVSYLMYFAVDITKRNKGYGSMTYYYASSLPTKTLTMRNFQEEIFI